MDEDVRKLMGIMIFEGGNENESCYYEMVDTVYELREFEKFLSDCMHSSECELPFTWHIHEYEDK